MRDINVKNLNSYVIKNGHIDCDKDTDDVLNESIVKPINDEMKIIMNKDMCVFFMWDDNNKTIFKYSKREDINESSFKYIIKIPTRILISSDLAFLATVAGKINMSGC